MTSVGIMASAVVAGGFGAEQRITIANTPDADFAGNQEYGTRVLFARAGRITKVRYYRRSGTSSNINLNVWNSSGTRLSGPHAIISGPGALYETFTLPTPVAVTAGQTLTCSIGAGTLPYGNSPQTVTNTADCTCTAKFVWNAVSGNFPNTVESLQAWLEPYYEPAL